MSPRICKSWVKMIFVKTYFRQIGSPAIPGPERSSPGCKFFVMQNTEADQACLSDLLFSHGAVNRREFISKAGR